MSSAAMIAAPRPDGNSLVEATITSGPKFRIDLDKPPHPLVLVGAQVYGLHETPFMGLLGDGCAADPIGGISCKYHFLASTDVLRAGQTFTVRDLAWREFKQSGMIDIG